MNSCLSDLSVQLHTTHLYCFVHVQCCCSWTLQSKKKKTAIAASRHRSKNNMTPWSYSRLMSTWNHSCYNRVTHLNTSLIDWGWLRFLCQGTECRHVRPGIPFQRVHWRLPWFCLQSCTSALLLPTYTAPPCTSIGRYILRDQIEATVMWTSSLMLKKGVKQIQLLMMPIV